jgi:hypothetical protein
MTGRIWLLAVVVATIFSTSGCIIPGYDGVRLAQRAGPECEVPLAQRNQVYVFVVGGDKPFDLTALEKFRRGLNSQGFANVVTGPSLYYYWMSGEMRRIHSENPTAMFVIAGLDLSAPVAVKLSEKAAKEGLPVYGVIISESKAKTAGPRGDLRTLFLGNNSFVANSITDLSGFDNSSQLNPAADPKNISEVVQFLKEIASLSPLSINHEAVSDWVYPFSTDSLINTEVKGDSEWEFLFDHIGGVTRGIADPLPERRMAPSTGNTAAIKP